MLWSDWKNVSKLGECQLYKHFISNLEKRCKTFLFYVLEGEMFAANVRFTTFTMLCNNAEYKRMGLGQLYNVQSEMNIIYKSTVWVYSFSTTVL